MDRSCADAARAATPHSIPGVRTLGARRHGYGDPSQALLLALSVFAVLMAYYLLKPAREALLSTAVSDLSRTELRSLALVAQGMFACVLAGLYARLADRMTRPALIPAVNGLLVVGLAVAAMVLRADSVRHAAAVDVAVYVGAGALTVIVLAQFWAFATDLEGRRAGRLLPLLSLAASAGGAAGAWMAGQVVHATSNPGGVLFLAAAGALAVATALGILAEHRRTGTATEARRQSATGAAAGGGVLSLLAGHQYLLGVALVTLLAQWASSNGEHLLFGFIQEAVRNEAAALGIAGGVLRHTHVAHATTAFYAGFFLWSNLAALALQLVVVCACARGLSGRNLLLVLPVVTLVSGAALLLAPVLASIKVLKVAENAARYSLNNTAAHLLWLPTSAEMKYKAKIAIESTVVRLADVLAAATAVVGFRLFHAPLESMVLFNLILVVVWLATAACLVKAQRLRLEAAATVAALPARTDSRELPVARFELAA